MLNRKNFLVVTCDWLEKCSSCTCNVYFKQPQTLPVVAGSRNHRQSRPRRQLGFSKRSWPKPCPGQNFYELLWPGGTLCPLLKMMFLLIKSMHSCLSKWSSCTKSLLLSFSESLITWHTLVSMATTLAVFKGAQKSFLKNTSNQRHCTNCIICGI